MPFSKRTGWETQSNRISELAALLAKNGHGILDLTSSNPTQCGFSYLNPTLLAPLADAGNLSYEPTPRGLLEARLAVCGYYRGRGIEVSPEQVFLTAGTSEAYQFVFRLLTEPGDILLAPRPSYPLLDYLAGLQDLEVERYPLVYQNGWKVDGPKLGIGNSTRPKALVVVNPNNPTGNFTTGLEREAINQFVSAEGAAVISDEVFLDFAFERQHQPPPSFAQNSDVLTFTLSGISKAAGLPQMKLAWMVVSGPKDAREAAFRRLEVISDTYLSVSTPAQRALPFWLGKQKEITEEILGRLKMNRAHLARAVSGLKEARLLDSQGGWYAVLQVAGDVTDEEWAMRLLRKEHVLIHPGYLFDFEAGNFLVLSLLPPPAIFSESTTRLAARLQNRS